MTESNIKESNMNSERQDKEIDLLELGSSAWRGLKGFFGGILGILIWVKDFMIAFIIFSIRKVLWVGSFALLGIVLGLVYSSIKKPYYTSMLEGFSGGVDNTVVIDHINQLNRMVSKPDVLANYLDIEIEDAEKIRFFEAFYGIDVNFDGKWDYVDEKKSYNPRNLKDTVQFRVPSVFFVKIQLYDEEILPVLRERLFKHINNNTYIQTLYEIDKRHKEALIAELEREIEKIDRLDTLQHLLRFSRDKGLEMGEKIYLFGSSEPELRLFYNDILSLYGQKQGLQRSIEISDEPVIIVQDFIAAQWEERTKAFYAATLAAILVIIGYAAAICWTFRKRLRKMIVEEPIKYFEE